MVIRMRDPFATLTAIQRAMDSAMGSDWFGSRTAGHPEYGHAAGIWWSFAC